MPKMIQMRNVPEALHRELKARAATEGLSLSDFLIREARGIVQRPTAAEMRERLSRRSVVNTKTDAAKVIRSGRPRR